MNEKPVMVTVYGSATKANSEITREIAVSSLKAKPGAAGCGCAPMSLSSFSDDEIAREYHARALRKVGDHRVGVWNPHTIGAWS